MLTWDFNPEIFSLTIPGIDITLAPRYYSLTFIAGFLIGYHYIKNILMKRGYSEENVSSLLVHLLLGTLIGARLGHCLFYDPGYYLSPEHFIEIFQTWKGGLASHGGYIGVIIATILYLRKVGGMSFLWLTDRLAAPSLMTGGFIRFGNLLNSEIVGRPTDAPWGVVFKRLNEDFPRHPTQVYESLGYLAISGLLFYFNEKKTDKWPVGRLLGVCFVLGFSWRLFVEFFKENQEAFEQGMFMNMGQLLSIPFILFGLFLMTGKQEKIPAFGFLLKPFGAIKGSKDIKADVTAKAKDAKAKDGKGKKK